MPAQRVSDANVITAQYMDSLLIEERLIGSKVADLHCEFYGRTYDMPVMTPAFSHLGQYNGREKTGLEEYSEAAAHANILNFCGMMENETFAKIAATGADTVRIVKPYADGAKVYDQLRFAEDAGAVGVGMDIDHIFGPGGYDVCVGELMAAQTEDMLRSYVETTKLPFVIKGVLSVRDAVLAADIGASAIIVSHHHGRLPYAVPPMMVLPAIREALAGRNVKIIVDCGIESGADVFKALALGADAAAVGRSMLPSLEKDGTPGVERFLAQIASELRYVMSNTGAATVADIDATVLHRRDF
ncbi:MAG: alpha-hydroxy-acid oxidizing protein [Lachnospiraceae bacterium]|nr:alpha-hydroxy-acid oxidizing protein [Lachnospiraceae bacterium]